MRTTATRSTPPRRPGSVRRTTTHDCIRLDGLGGPVTIRAGGRDLLTLDGTAEVLNASRLDVQADFAAARIKAIASDPPHPALAELVGAGAFKGFRALVDAAIPDDRDAGSVRYQLLDDLPTALMLSARVLRASGIGLNMTAAGRLPIDICAGWAAGGTLLAGLTDQGPPLTHGPQASSVRVDDDPLAWHEFAALAPNSTRRHRRIDVWQDSRAAHVEGFFRDSFADTNGIESVVHEYTVHGTLDPATSKFLSCEADSGPLPYPECASAAASAQRIEGLTVAELRNTVRKDFVGPSTCTHLNDTFRSLQDVSGLLRNLKDAT